MGTFIKSDFRTTDTAAPKLSRVFARDSFNRANSATPGALEIGGMTWKASQANTWHVKDQMLQSGDTTGASPADCIVDPGVRDGVLRVKVHALGQAGMAGLVFRKASVGQTCWVYYPRSGSYGHTLTKRTASDSFTVVEPTGPVIPYKYMGEITVEMRGNRIICSVDGVVTHDITDDTYVGQTGVGVTTRQATAASPAKFDDWSFSE